TLGKYAEAATIFISLLPRIIHYWPEEMENTRCRYKHSSAASGDTGNESKRRDTAVSRPARGIRHGLGGRLLLEAVGNVGSRDLRRAPLLRLWRGDLGLRRRLSRGPRGPADATVHLLRRPRPRRGPSPGSGARLPVE